ncbi:MAG: tRNA 2-thiouridine(34) synthase MnmA [Chloroflexota bacterium]
MTSPSRVVVAMSGGVDSSVAAALLQQQGYEVIGVMLRLWSEKDREAFNRCCTPEAMNIARRVCDLLGIPFYVLDARQAFYDVVVQCFFNGYTQGITPNPCLLCNQSIRWGFLLERALAMGAAYLATGHYAHLRLSPEGNVQLLRSVDREKDQSYVLSMLNQEQLSRTLLPIGKYKKPEVRQLAHDVHLPVAERKDSQDLCFLGEEDYRAFLLRHHPNSVKPGPIINTQGEILGEHRGLALYTIGQRKGLRIPARHPLYVLEKLPASNTLVVGGSHEMGRDELTAGAVNWIAGTPPDPPLRASIKIRYRATEVSGTITPVDSQRVQVHLDEPLRDITPGQAAVFYNEELCLGGGLIE